jgi:hypothetical protein
MPVCPDGFEYRFEIHFKHIPANILTLKMEGRKQKAPALDDLKF